MKYIKYTTVILIAISVVFTILFLIAPATLDNMGMVGPFLVWAYILTGLAILFAVGLPLIDMLKNPKKLKKTGINLGLVILLFVVSYVLASGEALSVNVDPMPTEATWKWTDTGLIMTYILAAVAFGGIIFGGLINTIRNR